MYLLGSNFAGNQASHSFQNISTFTKDTKCIQPKHNITLLMSRIHVFAAWQKNGSFFNNKVSQIQLC